MKGEQKTITTLITYYYEPAKADKIAKQVKEHKKQGYAVAIDGVKFGKTGLLYTQLTMSVKSEL